MLQANGDLQTRETAATMGKHISRMENYVSSMSNLRRMEDTQPEYQLIDLQPFPSSQPFRAFRTWIIYLQTAL